MKPHTLIKLAIIVALLVTVASATPIITFNEATGGSGANSNQSVGWQFDVLTQLTVTALGWFDEGLNGLGAAHQVGIWNSAGTLLASITVPIGTGASLDGQYRMASISALVLTVGNGYIIGGQNFTTSVDRLAANVTQTVDSRIRYIDATFSNVDGIFERPTQVSIATTGFYGPMFATGSATATPEPGSIALLAGGLAFLLAGRRSRRF